MNPRLSAFPFGLKLVNGCSVWRLSLNLHLLILILEHKVKKEVVDNRLDRNKNIRWESIQKLSPYLKVFAHLNLLWDHKHFLFSVDSLGKSLVLVFPYICHLLQLGWERKSVPTSTSYCSPPAPHTSATDLDALTHIPLNYGGLQLPGCSFSPEFPELVGCTLDSPTQARCWDVSPGWMTALRRDTKETRHYDTNITYLHNSWKIVPSFHTLQFILLPSFVESTKKVCLFFILPSVSRRWSSPFSLSIF